MSDRPKAAPGVVSVALFRGINVGGRNRLPMKELVSELEALGLSDVGTYIQSAATRSFAAARRVRLACPTGSLPRSKRATAFVLASSC